jgi:hypothetical protein
MNGDDPIAFDARRAESELATQPVKKITWALAGRVTDPGRYMLEGTSKNSRLLRPVRVSL